MSIARLLPAEGPEAHAQGRSLAERTRRTRVGHPLGEAASIREMTEEGRR